MIIISYIANSCYTSSSMANIIIHSLAHCEQNVANKEVSTSTHQKHIDHLSLLSPTAPLSVFLWHCCACGYSLTTGSVLYTCICTCESLMCCVYTYGGSVVYWCKIGSHSMYVRTYLCSYVLYLCTYICMYICVLLTLQHKLYMRMYIRTYMCKCM